MNFMHFSGFTDLDFIFMFLPVVLIASLIFKGIAKDVVLLIASYLFYFVCDINHLFFFAICIFLNVLIGRKIANKDNKNRRLLFFLGIIFNVGMLTGFKFLGTFKESVLLPLGLSFLTFKSISYLIDVYYEKITLDDNPLHDVQYLSIFTQLQSGPIARYSDFEKIKDKEDIWKYRVSGIFKFSVGFCKKIVIADVLAKIVKEIFSTSVDDLSTIYAWLGAICFSLQLFYDFSGYSDMANGITEFLGFKSKENFNYPYMTKTVSGFWKRWHISLSEWFRDYVYIPLGGSRKGKYKTFFNLFVVWFLTGMWHGLAWNFIIWGMGYFILISFERIVKISDRIKTIFGKSVYRILVLVFIIFEWVMFRAKDASYGISYIIKMLNGTSNHIADKRAFLLLSDYCVFIIAAIIFCFPVVPYIENKLENRKTLKTIYDLIYCLVAVAGFVLAISFIVSGQNNPFLYGNF